MVKLFPPNGHHPMTGEAPAMTGAAWPEGPAKIAYMTNGAKNRLHDIGKNRPHDRPKNRPEIINPVGLVGVMDTGALRGVLVSCKQISWCSRVRLLGLLLLVDYICRHLKKGTISISADLAHQFVSKLRKRVDPTTVTEPLLLLVRIGILRVVRPAAFVHVKTSAVYCFADLYANKKLRFEVVLTPKLGQKRACASDRREKRFNRKFPWRETLLADLSAIRFSESARPIIAKGYSGKGVENLLRVVSSVDTQNHSVKVSERGQITTSIGSCPRELQPHLLLEGELTVFCDISNAHWNFLPLILANRLAHVSDESGRQEYVNNGWREHNRLVVLLNDGDFYRKWCVDPQDEAERKGKKNILNILLNSRNEVCENNVLYRRLRAEFPITFRIIEDIKRRDPRNLGKQLHRFTADAVAAALLETQRSGIAVIPHVDALICQERNRLQVCVVLGKQIFAVTGVCSAVGGIRYSPLTEIEAEVLAFDENTPSYDGMSYDEWEAVRLIKCVAALKLMRRCPPLFAPLATCGLTRAA
jgi:hypothetical protein